MYEEEEIMWNILWKKDDKNGKNKFRFFLIFHNHTKANLFIVLQPWSQIISKEMFISIKQHAHVHIIILFNLKRKKKRIQKKIN